MIKLGYITGEMSDDFDKVLELGANAGINTVQLRMGLFGKLIHQLNDDDIPRIKDTLANNQTLNQSPVETTPHLANL